ncbi:hypothetical protein [Thalassiella azotivora]
MSDLRDDVPAELRGTVDALRRQGDALSPTQGPDLDGVLHAGRGQVRRRRVVAGVAAAVVVAGVAFTGVLTQTLGDDRSAPPAGPSPTEPTDQATVQVAERPVTDLYPAAEEVLADAGVELGERLAWSVGQVPVYYWPPVADELGPVESIPEPTYVPVDGFPREGYPATVAGAGVVDENADGFGLEVHRVDGGLPLEQDYCRWWAAQSGSSGMDESPCVQERTSDGGLLVTLAEYHRVHYVWTGGQVTAFALGDLTPRIPLETLEEIVTDPRLRW